MERIIKHLTKHEIFKRPVCAIGCGFNEGGNASQLSGFPSGHIH